MSEEQKQKSNSQDATASGGYQTPINEEIRKTGAAVESDAKNSAKPESPGEDSVAGSPNQGTESR
ncbi:hypothetical protein [Nostoc sp. MS1]|uniref:hypothetical protein n=1 Tax=Nostoc sp. MS1 TaxID=2764711 RepID=UPI001CC812EE|nr:hypothetical protein [Nostoc sp. MS1]BCL35453.1 hypothetical protein NSMS1_19000 [Nostoc sp. MS1]